MINWIKSEANPEDLVVFSSVKLTRNFKDSKFTDKLKIDEAQDNILKVYDILSEGLKDSNLELIKLWEYDHNFSKGFIEKNLISNKLLDRREKSGFILNKDNTLSVMINEEDNLGIKCISDGLNLKEEYSYADKIDDIIENKMQYAFHQDYGYLTASPSKVGTGLKASAVIHLPVLTANQGIASISKGLNKVGISIASMYNEMNQVYGNLYLVSNQITLGVKEEEIVNNLESVVFNIINEEKKNREIIMTKYNHETEDRIFRAQAILKSARLLNSKEILDLLSNVRLGVELGIINIEKKVLNNILILTRDVMIQSKLGANTSSRDKDIERARIVSELLGNY